jgi:hypothetical protein
MSRGAEGVIGIYSASLLVLARAGVLVRGSVCVLTRTRNDVVGIDTLLRLQLLALRLPEESNGSALHTLNTQLCMEHAKV